VSARFIRDLISFLIDTFIVGAGRALLWEINQQDPPEIVALAIGLTFWALLIFLACAVALNWW
jgi:hypothetical protein